MARGLHKSDNLAHRDISRNLGWTGRGRQEPEGTQNTWSLCTYMPHPVHQGDPACHPHHTQPLNEPCVRAPACMYPGSASPGTLQPAGWSAIRLQRVCEVHGGCACMCRIEYMSPSWHSSSRTALLQPLREDTCLHMPGCVLPGTAQPAGAGRGAASACCACASGRSGSGCPC